MPRVAGDGQSAAPLKKTVSPMPVTGPDHIVVLVGSAAVKVIQLAGARVVVYSMREKVVVSGQERWTFEASTQIERFPMGRERVGSVVVETENPVTSSSWVGLVPVLTMVKACSVKVPEKRSEPAVSRSAGSKGLALVPVVVT